MRNLKPLFTRNVPPCTKLLMFNSVSLAWSLSASGTVAFHGSVYKLMWCVNEPIIQLRISCRNGQWQVTDERSVLYTHQLETKTGEFELEQNLPIQKLES